MEEGIAASRVKLGLCVHLYGGLAGWRMGDEPRRAEMQEEVRACVYYRCHFLGWGLRTGGGIRFDCRSRSRGGRVGVRPRQRMRGSRCVEQEQLRIMACATVCIDA
jgi:hypothetical protein